jgi:hypothetical protein
MEVYDMIGVIDGTAKAPSDSLGKHQEYAGKGRTHELLLELTNLTLFMI